MTSLILLFALVIAAAAAGNEYGQDQIEDIEDDTEEDHICLGTISHAYESPATVQPHQILNWRSSHGSKAQPQPLKIRLDFDAVGMIDHQAADKTQLKWVKNEFTEQIKDVITQAAQFWESALSVANPSASFEIGLPFEDGRHHDDHGVKMETHAYCGNAYLGQNRKTVEVGASELLVYVVSSPNDTYCNRKRGVLAFAKGCAHEPSTGRPLVGFVGVCQGHRDPNLVTMKHELLHILGFDSSNRKVREKQLPNPFYTEQRNVTRDSWKTIDGQVRHSVMELQTPRVVEEMRAHFGCPHMTGAEIENHGGRGTKGAHWEIRQLAGEGMVGMPRITDKFSRITFAVLEDVGWWIPDYSKADKYTFGKNYGCELVEQSCYEYTANANRQYKQGEITFYERLQKSKPYCSFSEDSAATHEDMYFTCSLDRTTREVCALKHYKNENITIPVQFRYYSDPAIGGTYPHYDYCSMSRHAHYGDPAGCLGPGLKPYGDTFGKQSRCFDVAEPRKLFLTKNGKQVGRVAYAAACYKVACDNSSKTFTFQHVSQTGKMITSHCRKEGDLVQVDGNPSEKKFDSITEAAAYCPAFEEVCDN